MLSHNTPHSEFQRGEAMKNLLRTHTTAVSARMLYQCVSSPHLSVCLSIRLLLYGGWWRKITVVSLLMGPETTRVF